MIRYSPKLPHLTLGLLVTLLQGWSAAAPLRAQDLISAADLVALPTPAADHRISYGSDDIQFGDLYLPDGPGPHPVLAFIHGGCFLSVFDIAHSAGLSRAVADEGYAVWSIEYRRVGDPGGGWPGSFQDVGAGLDHLRAIAGDHALDLGRVVVGGHSAGGALALWAAGRGRIQESSELWVEDPLEVGAVLGLAAVGDIEAVQMRGACGNVVDRLMGGTPAEVPERYAAASPMHLVPLEVPVTSVVGALDDAWTPPSLSWVYRARSVGSADVRVVELPESGHFEMIVATASSWPLVVSALHETFASVGGRRPAPPLARSRSRPDTYRPPRIGPDPRASTSWEES